MLQNQQDRLIDGADQGTPGPVIIAGRVVNAVIEKADVEKALEESDLFREISRNLDRMATGVYRDPVQFLGDVRETAISGAIGEREVVLRIKLDPGSYGQYCGAGGIFSSQQERVDYRHAIAGRPGLVGVADHMIAVAHGIRMTMAQDRQELAERGKVVINMPNASIIHAIKKKQPISEAQSARISEAVRAFEKRFGDDIGRLRTARKLESIAQKHGLDIQQLTAARQVLKTLNKGQTLARAQTPVAKQSKRAGVDRCGKSLLESGEGVD